MPSRKKLEARRARREKSLANFSLKFSTNFHEQLAKAREECAKELRDIVERKGDEGKAHTSKEELTIRIQSEEHEKNRVADNVMQKKIDYLTEQFMELSSTVKKSMENRPGPNQNALRDARSNLNHMFADEGPPHEIAAESSSASFQSGLSSCKSSAADRRQLLEESKEYKSLKRNLERKYKAEEAKRKAEMHRIMLENKDLQQKLDLCKRSTRETAVGESKPTEMKMSDRNEKKCAKLKTEK